MYVSSVILLNLKITKRELCSEKCKFHFFFPLLGDSPPGTSSSVIWTGCCILIVLYGSFWISSLSWFQEMSLPFSWVSSSIYQSLLDATLSWFMPAFQRSTSHNFLIKDAWNEKKCFESLCLKQLMVQWGVEF